MLNTQKLNIQTEKESLRQLTFILDAHKQYHQQFYLIETKYRILITIILL